MAKQLQIRRGTTMANDVFIGAEGEITMDTTTKGLRVHDGQTAGGFKIDTVVDFQVPTASNNYTWYRKYSSGWVEQGGTVTPTSVSDHKYAVNIPVEMADANYNLQVTMINDTSNNNPTYASVGARAKYTTYFTIYDATDTKKDWKICGMAA